MSSNPREQRLWLASVAGSDAISMANFDSEAATQGIVEIVVGDNNTKFHIHRALLIAHSEYFRNALEGPWKEAKDRKIVLDDIEPTAFGVFVEWLYQQSIPGGTGIIQPISQQSEAVQSGTALLRSIKAYVCADRLLASSFRAFMTQIAVASFPPKRPGSIVLETIKYAFENIPPGRTILQALVDDYARSWNNQDSSYSVAARSQLPTDFNNRVTHRLDEGKKDPFSPNSLTWAPRCYMEHNVQNPQELCDRRHMRYDHALGLGFFEDVSLHGGVSEEDPRSMHPALRIREMNGVQEYPIDGYM